MLDSHILCWLFNTILNICRSNLVPVREVLLVYLFIVRLTLVMLNLLPREDVTMYMWPNKASTYECF